MKTKDFALKYESGEFDDENMTNETQNCTCGHERDKHGSGNHRALGTKCFIIGCPCKKFEPVSVDIGFGVLPSGFKVTIQSQDEKARSRKADGIPNRMTGYALKSESNKRDGSPDTQTSDEEILKMTNEMEKQEREFFKDYCNLLLEGNVNPVIIVDLIRRFDSGERLR